MKRADKALEAARLYGGSIGCHIKVSQKLYDRYMKECRKLADLTGIEFNDCVEQIGKEATLRGFITPKPGKDY